MPTIVGGSIVGITITLNSMDIKEKFGNKVRVLREEKGFSIEHLANISDVDRNYISDIEKGKRNVSIEIIEKIITGLETDLATFFNDKEFKK
jgi:transcriptional regulator with XRE-family HTH domain